MVDRGNYRELAKLAIKAIKKEMQSKTWFHHVSAGRPRKYPDALILIIAVYREIFGLTFREAEGFANEVFNEFGIEVPDYSTIERRLGSLKIDLRIDKRRLKGAASICIYEVAHREDEETLWRNHRL